MWDIQPKMSLMQVTKDTHGASLERKPFISQRHRGGAHYQPRRAFAGAVAGGRDARTPRTEGSAGRGRPAPRRPPACSQPASQPLPRSGPTSRPFGRLAGVTRERSRRLTSRGNGRPRFPSLGTPPPSAQTHRQVRRALPGGPEPRPLPRPAGLRRPRRDAPVASGLARDQPGRARGRRRRAAPGRTHAPPRSRWRFVFKLRLAPPARNYSPQDALRPPGRLSMRGRASVRGVRGWPRRCVRPPLGLERCCGSVWAPC